MALRSNHEVWSFHSLPGSNRRSATRVLSTLSQGVPFWESGRSGCQKVSRLRRFQSSTASPQPPHWRGGASSMCSRRSWRGGCLSRGSGVRISGKR